MINFNQLLSLFYNDLVGFVVGHKACGLPVSMTTLPHGRNLLGCDHGMGVGVLNSRRDDTINRGALDSSITEVRKCVAAREVVVMMKSGRQWLQKCE